MAKNNYLDVLKSMSSRPKKLKVKQKGEVILNEQENKDMNTTIINWFIENPYPKDKDVHKFAESLGIDPDAFEVHIYRILSDVLTEGRAKDFKGSYDASEMKKGIKVEMEHTKIPIIAEKIAKDHLAEIPDYYTRLIKMEKEAGIED